MKDFDIFWLGENGPIWLEAIDTLETAKARFQGLPPLNSGGYAVYDRRTGKRIALAQTAANEDT
jgi:hypothetical protein